MPRSSRRRSFAEQEQLDALVGDGEEDARTVGLEGYGCVMGPCLEAGVVAGSPLVLTVGEGALQNEEFFRADMAVGWITRAWLHPDHHRCMPIRAI